MLYSLIMTTTQEQQIIDQVKRYCDKANELYGIHLDPIIKFNLKGTTAGTANPATNTLRFNMTALKVAGGWEHLLNETVPHEVAHLVQYSNCNWPKNRRSNPPHGVYWKKVMMSFGVEPERCHSLDLPKARVQKKWNYTCRCRSHQLSTRLHNQIRKGQQKRYCRTCKNEVRFNP